MCNYLPKRATERPNSCWAAWYAVVRTGLKTKMGRRDGGMGRSRGKHESATSRESLSNERSTTQWRLWLRSAHSIESEEGREERRKGAGRGEGRKIRWRGLPQLVNREVIRGDRLLGKEKDWDCIWEWEGGGARSASQSDTNSALLLFLFTPTPPN